MPKTLRDLLGERGEDLAATVFERLRASSADHYRNADESLLLARCRRLVENLIEALHDTPARFLEYIAGITSERIAEGYRLDEIQRALSILETEAWRICAHQPWDKEQTLRELGTVTEAVGAAKDRLARSYVERLEQSRQKVTHLEQKLEQLFGGTDTMALGDE